MKPPRFVLLGDTARGGNYAGLVRRFAAAGVGPGEVVEVDVLHDDGCPALRGGVCRCDPRVVIRRPDRRARRARR